MNSKKQRWSLPLIFYEYSAGNVHSMLFDASGFRTAERVRATGTPVRCIRVG
jgi:hypothetical protein